MSRFARGRAALGGMGFRGSPERGSGQREEDLRFELSDSGKGKETAKSKQDLRFESSDLRSAIGGGLKGRVEEAQGQNLNLDLNLGLNWELNEKRELESDGARGRTEKEIRETEFDKPNAFHSNSLTDSNSKAKTDGSTGASAMTDDRSRTDSSLPATPTSKTPIRESSNSIDERRENSYLNFRARPGENATPGTRGNGGGTMAESTKPAGGPGGNGLREFGAATYASSAKEMVLARELRVGQGPVCGPIGVRAEVLDRVRQRDAARAKAGTRSP